MLGRHPVPIFFFSTNAGRKDFNSLQSHSQSVALSVSQLVSFLMCIPNACKEVYICGYVHMITESVFMCMFIYRERK